jgi:hypothetical protein
VKNNGQTLIQNKMENKEKLIKLFKESCNRFWEVDVNIQVFKGISRIDGIKEWDRNKMDIPDKEFTLIRVVFENEKYLIKKWVSTNIFDEHELTQQEFKKLQKCYFGKYL